MTSDLAEISGGLDALPLTPPSAAPVLPRVPAALRSPETFLLDARRGRRPASAARLDAFAAYALARPERALVVCGHARWFRSFFDAFLPPSAASVARCVESRHWFWGIQRILQTSLPPSNRTRFPRFLDRPSSPPELSTTEEREPLKIRSGTLKLKVS